jgi:hypothetical protein
MNPKNQNPNDRQQEVGITKQYVMMPVFEEGSAKLAPEDNFEGLMRRWKALTHHVVRIIGYADVEREGEELARMRAEAVQKLLLQRGIASNRFDAVSWRLHGPPARESYRDQLRRAWVAAYNAKLGPEEWQPYFGELRGIQDALSLGLAEDKVCSVVLRVLSKRMLPSKETAPAKLDDGDFTLECAIAHPREDRWATLSALMSKNKKLKDLWLQEDALGFLPLKRAVYDARLGAVKPGVQVENLYSSIGERAPERYYTGEQGGRLVEFRYRGFGRDSWRYTLDAGSGSVVRVSLTAG